MFRALSILCFAILPLLALSTGCGGSAEVAQTPAPTPTTTSTPVPTADSTQSDSYDPYASESGTSEPQMAVTDSGMQDDYVPPSDDTYNGGASYGNAGMTGYGAPTPSRNGFAKLSALLGINMAPSQPGSGMGDGYDPYMGAQGYGMGMPGGQQNSVAADPAPPEDADLLTKAKYAFSIGKEKEAVDYMRAYAVANEESGEIQQQTKWYAAGPKPATTVRFAAGVILVAPAALTDLKPIGSKQLQGGGGGGTMNYGQPGNQNTTSKERPFYSITGTFGEALVNSFKDRWTGGNLGSVFSDVTPAKPRPPQGMNAMGMMAGSGYGSSMGMGGDGYTPPSDGYDPSMMDSMGGGAPSPTQPKILPGAILTPGIVYLGTSDKQSTLLEKAAEYKVDGVFLFDVEVSPPNRINGVVQNSARLRLVNMKGDLLARSSELLNTKVERAQATSSGEDEVKKTMDKFFVQFDEKVKLADLPELKPEHAKARLTQLLSNKEIDKLHKLFEVSLFHSLKLISDEEKATCYLIVMEGSEGEALASGTLIDKQAVLEPLLPDYK
jgi:hypothetical protein